MNPTLTASPSPATGPGRLQEQLNPQAKSVLRRQRLRLPEVPSLPSPTREHSSHVGAKRCKHEHGLTLLRSVRTTKLDRS